MLHIPSFILTLVAKAKAAAEAHILAWLAGPAGDRLPKAMHAEIAQAVRDAFDGKVQAVVGDLVGSAADLLAVSAVHGAQVQAPVSPTPPPAA